MPQSPSLLPSVNVQLVQKVTTLAPSLNGQKTQWIPIHQHPVKLLSIPHLLQHPICRIKTPQHIFYLFHADDFRVMVAPNYIRHRLNR